MTLLVLVLHALLTTQRSIDHVDTRDYTTAEDWRLSRVDNKDVLSISDVQDGVYLIGLQEDRKDCQLAYSTGMGYMIGLQG